MNTDYELTLTGQEVQQRLDAVPGITEKIGDGNLPEGYQDISDSIRKLAAGEDKTRETVSVTLNPAAGALDTIDYTNSHIEVTVNGAKTDYDVSNEGTVVFKVQMGETYTIHYPCYLGFAAPDDESHVAAFAMRFITKTYLTLDSVASSVVLEQRDDPNWDKGGTPYEIDAILKPDSWVMAEIPEGQPNAGKYRAKLSSTNGLVFEDGTPWDGTYGDSMRHFDKCYYAITNQDGKSAVHLSRRRISEDEYPEMCLGTYLGHIDENGKLRSIPNVTPTASKTISQFYAAAQLNSVNHFIESVWEWFRIVIFHLVKFGTPAIEISTTVPGNMGMGLADAGSTYYDYKTGDTASLGDGTGEVATSDGTNHKQNKLFGLEARVSQLWQFVMNIFADNGNFVLYKGNALRNNVTSTDPDYVAKYTQPTASGAYIKEMHLGKLLAILPKNVVGSTSAKNWTDACWADPTGLRVVLFGGSSHYGAYGGLGASYSYNGWSYSTAYSGVRLAFRGAISDYQIVSGSELAALFS